MSEQQASLVLPLRASEGLGVLVGMLLAGRHPRSSGTKFTARPIPSWMCLSLFGCGILASLLFFLWQGVPILADNVESARVAATETGTGYFRLLSYMLVPCSLVLVAIRWRHAKLAAILSLTIILALANRSPILYLAIPIMCMHAFMITPQKARVKLVLGAIVVGVAVVGVGTYRIATQDAFSSYQEYAEPLANRNYLEVARISVGHYVEVVGENAILTKRLVDSGALPIGWGTTYLAPITTAMPGEQLTLDLRIKALSSADFIGGGTPPTLAGEGYANFLYVGSFAVPLLLVLFANQRFMRLVVIGRQAGDPVVTRLFAVEYSYLLLLSTSSQVAGIVGASTFPLTGMIVLSVLVRHQSMRRA